MEFLGKKLRFSYPGLKKLVLFKRGKGRYEKRLAEQDASMADMEIHEHIVVDGHIGHLQSPVLHRNYNSLSRYIIKHDEYSNWEANVYMYGNNDELPPKLLGTQAQRRRWFKQRFLQMPGSSVAYFLHNYIVLGGFLDGLPGLYFCLFKSIQIIHVKAKLYELKYIK
jgi:hypothetical protein